MCENCSITLSVAINPYKVGSCVFLSPFCLSTIFSPSVCWPHKYIQMLCTSGEFHLSSGGPLTASHGHLQSIQEVTLVRAPSLHGALFPHQFLIELFGKECKEHEVRGVPPRLCILTTPSSHGLVSPDEPLVIITCLTTLD